MGNIFGIKLGKRIKELRVKREITQDKLAELIVTSYKYLQRIEGKNPPDVRLSTIIRLAKALKVKPAELLRFLIDCLSPEIISAVSGYKCFFSSLHYTNN